MYDKITLPSLINLLSEKTGKPKKQCEDFLREFFGVLVDTLSEGENVKIKGIGSFKVIDVEPRKSVNVNTGEDIEIPGHKKITFSPAREMAEDVNSPFSMFETVEISNEAVADETEEEAVEKLEANDRMAEVVEVVDDTVENIKQTIEESGNPDNQAIGIAIQENSTDIQEELTDDQEEVAEDQEKLSEDPEKPSDTQEEVTDYQEEPEDNQEEITDEIEPLPRKRSFRFVWGFIAGLICMAIIAIVGYLFFADKFNEMMRSFQDKEPALAADKVMTTQPVPVETVSADSIGEDSAAVNKEIETSVNAQPIDEKEMAPTQPSDEKVYDTISKTRYLTTMAKAHYGNYNLWPYIYEENKAILGHPDRIRPGTKVVIPSLSKYGVNPNNPEDIKRAKQKGVEIYARFN